MKSQWNRVAPEIEVALQHHRAGRLQQAEAIYRKLPYNPDALHLRGDIARQLNRNDEAVELISKAIRAKPSNATYYFSLEQAYRALNRLDEVVASYRKLLAHVPDNALAHNNLGIALNDLGRLDEALSSYLNSIALKPDFADAYTNLGVALKKQGRLGEAAAAYRKAIELKPDSAEAHTNLGIVFAAQGKPDEAITCHQKALELKPEFAGAHIHMGHAFRQKGKFTESASCYRSALALKPDSLEAHYSLGTALKSLGQFNEAMTSYLNAIALKPDFTEAFNELGTTLVQMGNMAEAIACYQTAIAIAPNFAEAHNNMGIVLREQGKLEEAVLCYRKLLEFRPDFAEAHNNLGLTFHTLGKPDEAIACFRKALAYKPGLLSTHGNLLLSLQYSASATPEEVFAEHVRFAEHFEPALKPHWPTHPNIRDPRKRLKIGYVSPDLYNHAVAYFVEPILACHDKSQVEVYCYYNRNRTDHITERLKALADHWVPCKYLSDEQLAQQIQADGIDILVDLAGHTGDNRLLTFARKPAPVQVTYLGYPCTTGLTAIDYRITDTFVEPCGMTERFNTERLWRMPDMFCVYRPNDNSPEVIDHPPSEDNGYVTFGCFNNFAKVTDPTIVLWAKILHLVPTARLMLEIHGIENPVLHTEIETRLARLGIPVERLILIPRRKENQYVLYNRIDIALDPFPQNGGTTSMDTLWMGVPFITLAGGHFSSRMGVTVLSNAGLPELIAHSEEEYLEIAAALAQNPVRLKQIRCGLRQRVQASPLMDAKRFTANLEQAYRGMWNNWCSGEMENIDNPVAVPVAQQCLAMGHMPDDPVACNDQGNIAQSQGKLEQAEACYRKALALDPGYAAAHSNLGSVLAAQGQLDDALLCHQKALALDPGFAEGHCNMAITLLTHGRFSEAIASCMNAIALKPDFAEAFQCLGNIFEKQGDSEEAIRCYETVTALKPDYADAYYNQGVLLHAQGRTDQAIACYRQALAIRPDSVHVYNNLLFAMLYSARYTSDDIVAEHRHFAQRFEAPLHSGWHDHPNSRNPNKRLKIGYVSPDFRSHPVATFIEPVLASHDKAQFEVFCYYNNDRIDAVTRRIQALADHWLPCHGIPDEQLAERIRADSIDILVDLAGQTGDNRLLTFARKPAPVQVTYLGYPCTSGLSAIDYRITDVYAEPVGMTEQFNSERLWRLPESFFCFGPPPHSPAPPARPPFEDNGYVTFGCFNHFGKVSNQVIALWAAVLNKVPAARLSLVILGVNDARIRARVEERLALQGVPAERLILNAPVKGNHFTLYNTIDIALDPFPFNGHTTSLDTLWMGVPIVTLAGSYFTSRMGVTTLVNTGLPELVARNEQEYVDIAAALALDPARLKNIRTGLRERLLASPLMDARRFTANLEQAYRGMWNNWCRNAPASGT